MRSQQDNGLTMISVLGPLDRPSDPPDENADEQNGKRSEDDR